MTPPTPCRHTLPVLRDRLFDRTDHRLETDSRFRWRGDGVSRVENLSDIVFALALGMVVSASAPPQTFGDLQRFLFGTIPVAAAFVLLVRIWHQHFLFFRRFGLSSTPVLLINAALLFTILYLAYPLRFAFEALFAFVVAQVSDWGPGWARSEAMELTFARSGTIMAYFAGGYAVVHLLLGWLYSQRPARGAALSFRVCGAGGRGGAGGLDQPAQRRGRGAVFSGLARGRVGRAGGARRRNAPQHT